MLPRVTAALLSWFIRTTIFFRAGEGWRDTVEVPAASGVPTFLCLTGVSLCLLILIVAKRAGRSGGEE